MFDKSKAVQHKYQAPDSSCESTVMLPQYMLSDSENMCSGAKELIHILTLSCLW